jgi:hypothetical protein
MGPTADPSPGFDDITSIRVIRSFDFQFPPPMPHGNYRCLNLADFAIARLIGLLALLLFAALVSILAS